MHINKVFNLGLPKTGTTSLGCAMKMLGYKHNRKTDSSLAIRDICNGSFSYIKSQIEKYDFFEDTPYHFNYKWLLKNYPNAKFILTIRKDSNEYINSLLRESVLKKESSIHQLKKISQFGFPYVKGNEKKVIEYYDNHNLEIQKNVKKLLVLNTGTLLNKFDLLCDFLDIDRVDFDYPHENKTV